MTTLTNLNLWNNDIAVVPDAANASIGALTNLKYFSFLVTLSVFRFRFVLFLCAYPPPES